MTRSAPSSHLVETIGQLFVGRRSWSPPEMRGARVWESSLAEQLHLAARLEDLARRGGPRTAREYSERDWDRERLDPLVQEANVAAWNEHRAGVAPAKRARHAPRSRRLARWELALQAAVAEQEGV